MTGAATQRLRDLIDSLVDEIYEILPGMNADLAIEVLRVALHRVERKILKFGYAFCAIPPEYVFGNLPFSRS